MSPPSSVTSDEIRFECHFASLDVGEMPSGTSITTQWGSPNGVSFTSGLDCQGEVVCDIQRMREPDGSVSILVHSHLSEHATNCLVESAYKGALTYDPKRTQSLNFDLMTLTLEEIKRRKAERPRLQEVYLLFLKVSDSEGKKMAGKNKKLFQRLEKHASRDQDEEEVYRLAEAIRQYGREINENGLRELMRWMHRASEIERSRETRMSRRREARLKSPEVSTAGGSALGTLFSYWPSALGQTYFCVSTLFR